MCIAEGAYVKKVPVVVQNTKYSLKLRVEQMDDFLNVNKNRLNVVDQSITPWPLNISKPENNTVYGVTKSIYSNWLWVVKL